MKWHIQQISKETHAEVIKALGEKMQDGKKIMLKDFYDIVILRGLKEIQK